MDPRPGAETHDGPSGARRLSREGLGATAATGPLKLKGYGYAARSDLGPAMIAVAALGLVVFLPDERFSVGDRPIRRVADQSVDPTTRRRRLLERVLRSANHGR